ncbi:MAG: hypothetical protein KIT56_09750 [Gammaproteobacteria bacterium]|nr:hypothetical protein [Gammaproteobacteria bacterium]MCW5584135.1 hypothetical protein [Gammaproteobacteria bacterium]
MNYDFQYVDGSAKMHSKPEMIFFLNQEGVIKVAPDSGHSYEMKVIAEDSKTNQALFASILTLVGKND